MIKLCKNLHAFKQFEIVDIPSLVYKEEFPFHHLMFLPCDAVLEFSAAFYQTSSINQSFQIPQPINPALRMAALLNQLMKTLRMSGNIEKHNSMPSLTESQFVTR